MLCLFVWDCRCPGVRADRRYIEFHTVSLHIYSVRNGVEDDQILQDMGKVKNKVFQLARQYSQRIKNNRPLIRPRNRDSENPHGLKGMPAVHEESMPSWENGK